jgi:hypothetical protein
VLDNVFQNLKSVAAATKQNRSVAFGIGKFHSKPRGWVVRFSTHFVSRAFNPAAARF